MLEEREKRGTKGIAGENKGTAAADFGELGQVVGDAGWKALAG